MTTIHHAQAAVLWAILGSCLGSFLNVCVYRIPRRMSLFWPRSRCPRCGTAILARYNLPVLGWLALRGRCRDCGGGISPRYPAIELALGLLFALPYLVAVVFCSGDPWERIGPGPMFAILLASWTATWLGVLAIGLGLDARSELIPSRATALHRAEGGCEGPAASVPRSPAGPG
jgi:prepilin signal peptidase PulO-like enzyme (type II secretory pathway)